MIKMRRASVLDKRGQALVETLLTTVSLTIIVFAAVQLMIMVVNDLTMNEAAFAISRVAVVSKQNDVSSRTRIASAYLVLSRIDVKNIAFAAYDLRVEGKDSPGSHKDRTVKTYSTTIKYVQSVMFASLLSGPKILSFGNVNLIKSASRSWMVKSPDEDYYDKAYPDAPTF